jgi:hypothetical protein
VLVQAFEAGSEPPGGFHHREHVRVAWWYLRLQPLPEALDRLRDGLRRFATANGAPGRYHETITTAYALIVHDRLAWTGRTPGWDEFAALNPDLLATKPSILDLYYHPATLGSDAARRTFVPPDRPGAPALASPRVDRR